jgi:hypothetical protein
MPDYNCLITLRFSAPAPPRFPAHGAAGFIVLSH